MSCPIGTRIDGVPHFDVTVNEHNIDDAAKLIVQHIKKSWDPLTPLGRKDFHIGVTNKLVGYFLDVSNLKNYSKIPEKDRREIILIRIYGPKTELIVNRAQELRNIEELAKNNIVSPLYCTFANGYCYRYYEGKACTPELFTSRAMLGQSAHFLAKLHSMTLSPQYLKHHKMESTIFETIKSFIHHMPKRFPSVEDQVRYENNVPSHDKLIAEVDTLVHAASNLTQMSVGFCHNDLLLANIQFDKYDGQLHCMDHEYGGPNYCAYDIANHFNEICGWDPVDYDLYPNKETQLWWLRTYLEKMNELRGCKGHTVLDDDVDELYIQVEHMALVSHLFWAVWAQVQAHHSTNVEFDFIGYGICRLKEYFKRKEEILERYMNELILSPRQKN